MFVAGAGTNEVPLGYPSGQRLLQELEVRRHTAHVIDTSYHASRKEWQKLIEDLAKTLEEGLNLTGADDCDGWIKRYRAQVSLVKGVRVRLSRVDRAAVEGNRTIEPDVAAEESGIAAIVKTGRQSSYRRMPDELGKRESRPDAIGAPNKSDRPTIIYHGQQGADIESQTKGYSSDGLSPVVVTDEEHKILQAFMQANTALCTRDIEAKTGVSNVSRIVKSLANKYNQRFSPAIRRPASKGHGYHIRVREAGKAA
jgi:hypothetical protein